MATHICKNCGKKFTIDKRGRPPANCFDCRGKAEQQPSPKEVISSAISARNIPKQEEKKLEPTPPIPSYIPKPKPVLEDVDYEVVITNFWAPVYRGNDEKEANKIYEEYLQKSWQGYGQVGYERVSLFHYSVVESGRNKILVKECDPRKEME